MRYLETVADRLARAPIPWISGGGLTTLVLGLAAAVLNAWWLRSARPVQRKALGVGVGVGLALVPLLLWLSALRPARRAR
jgi:hypothetical protein